MEDLLLFSKCIIYIGIPFTQMGVENMRRKTNIMHSELQQDKC